MADLKTKKTAANVESFIDTIEDEQQRHDCYRLLELMREATGEDPVMWGNGIVGFGRYHYRYASGREGDWMLTGFSPRKRALSIYIVSGFATHDELMAKLGKYKTGKSCLYVNRLNDVDLDALKELVRSSIAHVVRTYGRTEISADV